MKKFSEKGTKNSEVDRNEEREQNEERKQDYDKEDNSNGGSEPDDHEPGARRMRQHRCGDIDGNHRGRGGSAE